MAFKMKGSPMQRIFGVGASPAKLARSSDVIATEGEYKGQPVDPRTGMPKGVSKPPSDMEVANADQIAMLREKMRTVEPFSDEEEAIRQQILRLRGKSTSPAQMKSPMKKGKTRFLDKVKSAAGAVKDTIKQEIKSPAGHGTSDSMTNRLSRNYKSRKKQARSSAAKLINPKKHKLAEEKRAKRQNLGMAEAFKGVAKAFGGDPTKAARSRAKVKALKTQENKGKKPINLRHR